MILFRLIKEGFLFAINSIIVNKLRTFLSLFGITIGIFAIISVFTVLDWMESSIKDSIESMGDNVVFVDKFPWSFDPNIAWWDMIQWPAVSYDDYEVLHKNSQRSESIAYRVVFTKNIKYKDRALSNASIWGTTENWEKIKTFNIEKGRYFSLNELHTGRKVTVLGYTTAEELFGDINPIGKSIIISGHKTLVVGVLEKEGEGAVVDQSVDELTIIPINYAKRLSNLKSNFIDSRIMIKSRKDTPIEVLIDEIFMLLRASRRLKPHESVNFSVNKASLLTQGFESVFAGINVGGWIIGGFSILVGGFGIANIMFVSVKERTNQIGIQKALGAKKRFILWQFLYESILLSIIGGILGLFFIFIGTLVVNYLFDLSIYLTLANIFMAIFISGTIGVVAGYAPAYAAAKMNPVDAIGYSFG